MLRPHLLELMELLPLALGLWIAIYCVVSDEDRIASEVLTMECSLPDRGALPMSITRLASGGYE